MFRQLINICWESYLYGFGIIIFYGSVSDPSYDLQYLKFEQFDMNLDFFKKTKRWPKELKNIIKVVIRKYMK